MKCEKCGYISFDYNVACPSCSKDLSATRRKLGMTYDTPEKTFDEFFAAPSSSYRTLPQTQEAELDLDSGEDFEFTLDD
ncbi:MAG: hypothetical protein WBG50_10765 [Desulfomonilaceae bacterium]